MISKLIWFLEGLKIIKPRARSLTPVLPSVAGGEHTPLDRIFALAMAGGHQSVSSIHGTDHWRAVAAVGLRLCDLVPEASRTHALLFGLVHDCRRENDNWDPLHGYRAATLIFDNQKLFEEILSPDEVMSLMDACFLHEKGQVDRERVDVGIAWDADRYNLRRLGYDIRRDLLSSPLSDEEHELILAEVEDIWRDPPDWPELIKEAGL